MLQPCENQKQAWPLLHADVPLLHAHVYGSMVPVSGCLPPAQAMPAEASIELREIGMIMEPWPAALAMVSATESERIMLLLLLGVAAAGCQHRARSVAVSGAVRQGLLRRDGAGGSQRGEQ